MSTPVETSEPVLSKLPDIVYKTWWPLVEQKFNPIMAIGKISPITSQV